MDIFKIHSEIIAEYESYINSFINISNPKINSVVRHELDNKRLWPDPLIQFNPSFEYSESIDKLIQNGIIHKSFSSIFKNNLFRHQVEAIKLGVNKNDFIVTSGTGSGKSLTYLTTIFDRILKNPNEQKGIKAIIVYPMNALINSQTKEIEKYANNYTEATGNPFPIKSGQYTGQEDQNIRDAIKQNPPDILLTNYMMLELIMTRHKEDEIRDSISRNLEILVFDELHTYRGRQGADVSLLIRRVKNLARKDVQCIGTSATMVSSRELTLNQQKEIVADVGAVIFGRQFNINQIIGEYLRPSLINMNEDVNKTKLVDFLNSDANYSRDEELFTHNELAKWIEKYIALEEKEETLVRRTPMTLSKMADELFLFTGIENNICEIKIYEVLKWALNLNSRTDKKRNYLPFKIHQFIAQTGSVYMTLDNDESQVITLNPGVYKDSGVNKKPLFPVVFSRVSGDEYFCVYKNNAENLLQPREFRTNYDEDEDVQGGYLIPKIDVWKGEEDYSYLPDNFFEYKKKDNDKLKIKAIYKNRLPERIYYDEYGRYSTKEKLKYEGWYMPAKLLFDVTSGTFYDTRSSEGTKLTKLGNEGRSTSTTVLSYAILRKLADNNFSYNDQKILSFTDNRQDAALQSGHFNDYLNVIRLRNAIYKALESSSRKILDHSNFSTSVVKALNLSQNEYASQVSDFPSGQKENEQTLQDYIMYRAIYDLRKGWRVILPNLEQCGLLEIDYKDLRENCTHEPAWEKVVLLKEMSIDERVEFLKTILDHFRKEYAIHSEVYLTDKAIQENEKRFREKLKAPWTLEKNENLNEPYKLRIEKAKSSKEGYFKSIGYLSGLGKYIKSEFSKRGQTLTIEAYNDFISHLLEKLNGTYFSITNEGGSGGRYPAYQLLITSILWKAGDGKHIKPDMIRMRTYKYQESKPNLYFQNIYKSDYSLYKTFKGDVHTAQNSNEERQERELEFINGDISTLFCSPTMELGIDISTLNVVHLRNVPPNPSNYAQRSGRAGRSGQGALVYTYCSGYSPHDTHYFKNTNTLVAGKVVPPKIDLCNEELLKSHLHAVYLTYINISEINDSLFSLFDDTNTNLLNLKNNVVEKLKINDKLKNDIKSDFRNIISDFSYRLDGINWFNEEWLENAIIRFPEEFNKSLDRWRKLYLAAETQLQNAQDIINDSFKKEEGRDKKDALRLQKQALAQKALLKNENTKNTLSEFYPYRYFASEGLLPGYNFVRLPIRVYIPQGDSGVFVSRGRFISMKEFGPNNLIYHNGATYKVNQIQISDIDNQLTKAKIVANSGYFLNEQEFNYEICPISEVELKGSEATVVTDLLEMSESKTIEQKRISCEDEERISHGYQIKTYFSVPGGKETIIRAQVLNDKDVFLNLLFIPAAKLYQVNYKWRIKPGEGFLIGTKSGIWKKDKQLDEKNKKAKNNIDDITEPIRSVKLYTHDTADALYIRPIKSLALDKDGIITLQYALKRAIENKFQVESNEIAVSLIGDDENPNIFIYEASEGSIGILSQIVNDKDIFLEIVKEAYKICKYEDTNYSDPASYDDLLSYYNQQYHLVIDRFKIKDALEKLMTTEVEILATNRFNSHDEHYKYLLDRIDGSSSTERVFLDYLYNNGYRLPDEAQKRINDIYVQPDFYYEPCVCVFCDGSPHDLDNIKQKDESQRAILREKGYDVVVYYYKDNLEELINNRKDIFRKIK